MNDVLARIMAYKRDEVAARAALLPLATLEQRAAAAAPCRDFAAHLRAKAKAGHPALIAEIKKASPSKGLIRADFDPASLALAYAEAGAACLSVLTDGPSFQGSDAHLEAARAQVNLPILRKDFLFDPYQVAETRALGGDCILIILAAVEDRVAADLLAAAAAWQLDALVEVHDAEEMARACNLAPALIGINNRSLRTFETKLEVFERLAPLAPRQALLVAESGIASPDDLTRLRAAGADAFLVGETLMRAPDVTAATRALLGTSEAKNEAKDHT